MRRALALPLLALLVLPAAASGGPQRALKQGFSSGDLSAAIPDGATLEHTITVPAKGEVSSVLAVHVRLDHARDSDLSITLIAPNGKSVLLSGANGGSGANYGSGSRDCQGTATAFGDGGPTSITTATAPFTGGLYKPQQPLAKLSGSRSDGTWKLRVTDSATGVTGTLYCWGIVLTRRAATIETARSGRTTA